MISEQKESLVTNKHFSVYVYTNIKKLILKLQVKMTKMYICNTKTKSIIHLLVRRTFSRHPEIFAMKNLLNCIYHTLQENENKCVCVCGGGRNGVC